MAFSVFHGYAQDISWELLNTAEGGRIYDMATLPSGDIMALAGGSAYVSENGGRSWQRYYEHTQARRLVELGVDTDGNILARQSVNFDPFTGLQQGALMASKDGRSWQSLPDRSPDELIYSVSAGKHHFVVAGGTEFDEAAQAFRLLPPRLYRSEDAGETWHPLLHGSVRGGPLDAHRDGYVAVIRTDSTMYFSVDGGDSWKEASAPRGTVGLAIADDGALYAWARHSPVVFRSDDQGKTWQSQPLPGDLTHVASLSIVNDTLFLGSGRRLLRSTDRAVAWEPIDFENQIPFSVIRAGNRFFVSTSTGLFRRQEGESEWERAVSGIHEVVKFQLASSISGFLYGSAVAGIFVRSGDAGATWSVHEPPGGVISSIVAGNSSTVFVGAREGMYRSPDGGETWHRTGLWCPSSLAIAPGGTYLLAAADNVEACQTGSRSVFRSIDDGVTWTRDPHSMSGVTKLAVSPTGVAHAATGNGLFRLEDNRWHRVALSGHLVGDVVADTSGLFVIASPHNDRRYFILASSDAGETWGELRMREGGEWNDLIKIGTNMIVTHTGYGVLWSADEGNTWSVSAPDIFFFGREDPLIADSNGRLFAVNRSQPGFWRGTLPVVTSSPMPGMIVAPRIDSPYPNPSQTFFTIPISLSQPSEVRVQVVDLLGRIVETVVDGLFGAGDTEVVWDGSNQSPGIYFLRISTGRNFNVHQIVLAR